MTRAEVIGSTIFSVLAIGVVFALGYFVHTPTTKLGAIYGNPSYVNYVYAVSGTTTLATFPGMLHTITFGTMGSSNVLTVYDSNTSTAPSTVMVKVTTASTAPAPFTLTLDSAFANGLTVDDTVTSTLTFDYQQN